MALTRELDWIEDRIFLLAQRFAVAMHTYAVMSKHYQLVIEVDPHAPTGKPIPSTLLAFTRMFALCVPLAMLLEPLSPRLWLRSLPRTEHVASHFSRDGRYCRAASWCR